MGPSEHEWSALNGFEVVDYAFGAPGEDGHGGTGSGTGFVGLFGFGGGRSGSLAT